MKTDATKKILSKQLACYVSIIEEEYADYITENNKKKLNRIKMNPEHSIQFSERNSISLFAHYDTIYFPKRAYKVLKDMSKLPGFGRDPNHRSCAIENYVLNDNTFEDYIQHAQKIGMTPLHYFQENLLHETLHLCGCGGSTSLEEGLTELKTREIAQKYGLLTSGCGYPKEVKIVLQLKEILGEEIIDTITFLGDKTDVVRAYFKQNCTEQIEDFYFQIREEMNKASSLYKREINNISDPIKKAIAYNNVNYQKVYEQIELLKKNYNK